jgi:cell division protein FtsI (penicillin-binding protein 3)
VAAPVFRDIADRCMARDQASQRPMLARVPARRTPVPLVRAGLQQEIALVCDRIGLPGQTHATGGEEWVRATSATDTAFVARTVSLRPDASVAHPGRMPDVRGLTLRDALFLLENRGLKVQASGTGRVREQSVAPGDPARRGLVVGLSLTPTATVASAPVALPAPDHTEIAENTLLIPAEASTHTKSAKPLVKPTAPKTAKPATTVTKPATVKEAAAAKSSVKESKSAIKPELKPRKPIPAKKPDSKTTQRTSAPPSALSAGTSPAKPGTSTAKSATKPKKSA